MDDKIKSAIEIAMEKAENLEDLTEKEKRDIQNKKKLDPVMLSFYRKKLQPDKLWEKFKGEDESLLVLAQLNIIDSLKFGLDIEEIRRRAKAIIALESLKKEQNTSAIQEGMAELEGLKENAEEEKNQIFNEFKSQIENNPQARTKVLEQNGAKIVLKLSVEDAIVQSKQWKQFIIDFENKYGSAFDEIIENAK